MESLMFSNRLEKKIISDLKLKDKKAFSFAIMKDSKLIAAVINSNNDNYNFDTLFELACVSKPYIAIAIMKLVEEGKIQLDEPVYKYIEKFEMKDIRYKKITIRMLMIYSAGFQSDTYKNKMTNKVIDFNKDELYNNLKNEMLRFNPGDFSIYSNTCYELLTALIEEVTGECYLDYIDKLLKPLNISIDIRRKPVEKYYYDEKYGPICWNLGGAGALVSNAIDLVKFVNMFNEPNDILKQETIDEMTKVHVNKYLESAYNPARGYGFGWDSSDSEKEYAEKVLIKTGRLLSASTAICVIPKYKIAVTLIVSNDCVKFSKMSSTLKDLLKIVLDDLYAELNIEKRKVDKTKKIDEKNKIETFPKYLNGIYYGLTSIFKIREEKNKIYIEKYCGNDLWEEYDSINYFLEKENYIVSDNYKYCFERKDKNTFLIELGEAVAQKEDIYQKNINYWLTKVGEKYIAINLVREIRWEYNNISLEVKKIKNNEALILESKNSNVKMPFIGLNQNQTTSFLNIPNDNIREAYIPYELTCDGKKMLHFKEYDYININDIDYLKSETVNIKKEKNIVLKISKSQGDFLEIDDIKNLDIIVLDSDLKIKENLVYGNKIQLLDGYIVIISDDEKNIKLNIK